MLSRLDPWQGNITYLVLAMFYVAKTSLELFKYRTGDHILALGDIEAEGINFIADGTTNWFKIATYVGLWVRLSTWTITLITQSLSMIGIGVSVN